MDITTTDINTMDNNNNNMPHDMYIRIGQQLVDQNNSDYISTNNLQKINIEKYKEEYLQKLLKQLNSFQNQRDELLEEYSLARDFNKSSIEKITELNKKLNNKFYLNNSTTFTSMRMQKIKNYLHEAIHHNHINSQKLYTLEQQITDIDLYIYKTNTHINFLR